VAVVGSRRPRCGGEEAAFAFAAHAARAGFAVVSGLALGCDSAAHRGCLEAGGDTLAVLPCGLDRVVPAANSALASRILQAGGVLASEYAPEVPAKNFRFVQRNRVIAGLSHALIVAEAQLKSGTLHAARFAREQRKPVACFLPANGAASPGCLHLVQNCGAVPLRNPRELQEFLDALSRAGAGL
jgi:DNA processing protein